MAALTTLAIIGLGVAAAGTVMQHSAQKKQEGVAKQQAAQMERQAMLEKKRADIQNARQLRASLRQTRIAQARMTNVAAQTGTIGSSSFLGGAASLWTQQGVNVGQFAQQGEISEGVFQTQTALGGLHAQMGKYQGRAAMGASVAGMGKTLFGYGMA